MAENNENAAQETDAVSMTSQDKMAKIRAMPVKYDMFGGSEWHGIPICPVMNQKKLDSVENFQFGESDVVVLTYPKAGTHFACDLISDIWSASKGLPEGSLPVYALEIGDFNGKLMSETPKVVFSHLPWRLMPKQVKDGKVKVVSIWRNPKDSVCSFYSFMYNKARMLRAGMTLSDMVDNYISGEVLYGGYFNYMKEWYPHKDESYMINFHYEDMKVDLKSCIMKLSKFLGLSITEEQAVEISERNEFSNRKALLSREHDKSFLRKGQAGGWKDELTAEDNNKLDDWIAKSMNGLDGIDLKC